MFIIVITMLPLSSFASYAMCNIYALTPSMSCLARCIGFARRLHNDLVLNVLIILSASQSLM